jgi:hypothetical protein
MVSPFILKWKIYINKTGICQRKDATWEGNLSATFDQGLAGFLSTPVLDAESALGVFPFDGAIDTGNHARATFEATRKFDGHLAFLGEGVQVCRAGIDAEPLLAGLTDLLIKENMRLGIVLKGIQCQLFGDLHSMLLRKCEA